jgi:hypothetical protein
MLKFIPEDCAVGRLRRVIVTGAEEPRELRDSRLSLSVSRGCSWISAFCQGYRLKGGYPAMDTQIRNTSGFANNVWLQMAVLVIAVGGLIALAAEYIW